MLSGDGTHCFRPQPCAIDSGQSVWENRTKAGNRTTEAGDLMRRCAIRDVRLRARLGLSIATAALALALTVASAAAGGKSSVVKAAYSKALKTTILVDGAGRTLYLLTSDPKNVSTCASIDPACPSAWPSLKAPAKAGTGVKAALLGRTKDGKQVTYNGHPLYHYSLDEKAGDLNGQGQFQDWYVISPKGTAIKKQ